MCSCGKKKETQNKSQNINIIKKKYLYYPKDNSLKNTALNQRHNWFPPVSL